MYRQILIHLEKKKLQKILWLSNPEHPLQTYTLNARTYVTTSALFLAIRYFNQLGIEVENTHPQISRIIKEDFCVDDMLTDADKRHQAPGGFNLRQQIANDIKTFENISPTWSNSMMENNPKLILAWNHSKDVLTYSVSAQKVGQNVTNRTILSETAQTFNPLGTIALV